MSLFRYFAIVVVDVVAFSSQAGEPMPFIDSQVKFMDNCAAAVHMRSKAAQELEGEVGTHACAPASRVVL